MPYYIGAGTPEWDEHEWETESGEPPESLYTYIEPWVAEATMLTFPETPGPKPVIPPERATYRRPLPAPKPGFFARLFGKKAPPVAPAEETPQLAPAQVFEGFKARQKATADYALWEVSGLAATCRSLGVKRVFGSYDGGNDESFTHLHGIEMSDSRIISKARLRGEAASVRCQELVQYAVSALMGRYDAGEFLLHGAVTIDCDACTITDETNADVVFGDKMAD
jgi:hypothetical protein